MNFSEDAIVTQSQIKEMISLIFLEHIPFNKVIGMTLGECNDEKVEILFSRRDDLIGNKLKNILHGGVTSTVLDTAGGLFAARSAFHSIQECSFGEFQNKFSKIGTIDLRVDFLRPGRGDHYVASAHLLRSGNKVAVCRMELHNEKNILLAVGTGTYLVG